MRGTRSARALGAGLLLTVLSITPDVRAHITLDSPAPRHPNDLKDGPCGAAVTARSTDPARISTFTAGQTITVTWTEFIDHDPSHYRIAFSRAGHDFADPTGYDDISNEYPVLLDGIADADAGSGYQYSVDVTLPNEPCETCTLQVIQVMHDKPPWGPEGGEDIYYQCADLVLEEDPNAPVDPVDPVDPIDPGDGGAGSATGGTSGTGGGLATGGTNVTDPDGPTDPTDPLSVPGSGGDDATGPMSGEPDSGSGSNQSSGCTLAGPPSGSSPVGWLVLLGLAWAARGRRRYEPSRRSC